MILRVAYNCWTGLYTIQEWKNLQWVPLIGFNAASAEKLRDELNEILAVQEELK